jgi:hypothetical protein
MAINRTPYDNHSGFRVFQHGLQLRARGNEIGTPDASSSRGLDITGWYGCIPNWRSNGAHGLASIGGLDMFSVDKPGYIFAAADAR